MTAPAVITVTIADGAPVLETAGMPASLSAHATRGERLVRVALAGHGDVEVRFAGADIADVDMRGGYVFAIPGAPYVVRAHVDGRLSITARLRRR